MDSNQQEEEYINGIPLSIKKKSLENHLTLALHKQNNKLESLKTSDIPDKEEQIYITRQNIELIDELRQIEIRDSIDYEFVNYCYNSGYFRTPEMVLMKEAEINEIREKIRIEKVRSSEEYNKHYHPFLFYFAWLFCPPLIFGIICEGKWGIVAGLFIYAYAFIPLAIIAAIATWIYCSCHASKHNVPMSDKATSAIIGYTTIGCTTYYCNCKKSKK